MRKILPLACALSLLGGAVSLSGCGGGSAVSVASTGRATVSIVWPDVTRLIPAAAGSVTVTFYQGTTALFSQTVARPSSGSTSALTFDSLPTGTLNVGAVAFPNADGTGTAQASAATTAAISAGQTTAIGLTMASTIASLGATPASPSVAVGATTALVATAKDASGNAVLTSALSWSSSDTSVATVSSSGVVTGIAAGGATVTVTESESGKAASVTVTVNGLVSVALSPASATLSVRGTQSFSAVVANSTNQSATWLVSEGASGGTVSSAGLYTAPATAGTYHVVATSVADPTKLATATVTVQSGGATVIVN